MLEQLPRPSVLVSEPLVRCIPDVQEVTAKEFFEPVKLDQDFSKDLL